MHEKWYALCTISYYIQFIRQMHSLQWKRGLKTGIELFTSTFLTFFSLHFRYRQFWRDVYASICFRLLALLSIVMVYYLCIFLHNKTQNIESYALSYSLLNVIFIFLTFYFISHWFLRTFLFFHFSPVHFYAIITVSCILGVMNDDGI